MLKNYRLIATVLVLAASVFGAFAQTKETDNYKDVLLNGKPAKLNLITGEVTYANGEIAKSRAAKRIKDSLLDTRTEIKTNLLIDSEAISVANKSGVVSDSTQNFSEVVNSKPKNSSEDFPENPESKAMTGNSMNVSSVAISADENEDTETSDFHTVKEGENLYVISKQYNTTLNELIVANRLETTLIKPGQNLRVRNFDYSEAEITWIVSKGDTLYSIAKKNNTTIDELIDLNKLSSSLIKIGQKLQVNQNSTLTKK